MQPSAGIGVDYRENFAALKQFFSFGPDQWGKKLISLDANYPTERRQPLADELLAYHRRLDAPKEVVENIERLRDYRTLVVSTGQQPGLLTGPLFTIYKAISAIKLAAKLKHELGREVVPVFWSATEDHDLEEINLAGLLNRQDELLPLSLPVPEQYHGWRVGEIPLSEIDEADFWEQVRELLGENEFTPSLLKIIKDSRQISDNWGDWFARQMLALFGRWGLVILNPNLPGLRRLLTPLMRSAIEDPLLFSKLVNEQGAKLVELGYKEQIHRPETACCFFLIENGQRCRVDFADGVYKTDNTTYSRDDLLKRLEEQPEAFSSNAVLRPSCGDYLLPNIAYIGGNAEIAYFAQLKPVFERLGLQMPIVLPRHSLTLVEARIQKILTRYSLDVGQLRSQIGRQLKEVGRKYCRLASPEYWEGLKRGVMAPLHELAQEAELERMAVPALEKGINKVAWQLDQLEEKTIQQCRKNNELLRQQLTRAHNTLFPQDKLQERKLNFFYFYNKYGEQLLPALLEALPEDSRQHYFMGIEVG